MWPLLLAGCATRPAVLAPFVTRPADLVVDRKALRLAPSGGGSQRRLCASESGSLRAIITEPSCFKETESEPHSSRMCFRSWIENGMNLNVFYVASTELFNLLTPLEQEEIFPEALTMTSVGITDFTLPTMYRWVRSNEGIRRTLAFVPRRPLPGQRIGRQGAAGSRHSCGRTTRDDPRIRGFCDVEITGKRLRKHKVTRTRRLHESSKWEWRHSAIPSFHPSIFPSPFVYAKCR